MVELLNIVHSTYSSNCLEQNISTYEIDLQVCNRTLFSSDWIVKTRLPFLILYIHLGLLITRVTFAIYFASVCSDGQSVDTTTFYTWFILCLHEFSRAVVVLLFIHCIAVWHFKKNYTVDNLSQNHRKYPGYNPGCHPRLNPATFCDFARVLIEYCM